MELFTREVDGEEIRARCYYNERKVSITGEGDFRRKQFYWGDDEMASNELEAIKMAYAFMSGLER